MHNAHRRGWQAGMQHDLQGCFDDLSLLGPEVPVAKDLFVGKVNQVHGSFTSSCRPGRACVMLWHSCWLLHVSLRRACTNYDTLQVPDVLIRQQDGPTDVPGPSECAAYLPGSTGLMKAVKVCCLRLPSVAALAASCISSIHVDCLAL